MRGAHRSVARGGDEVSRSQPPYVFELKGMQGYSASWDSRGKQANPNRSASSALSLHSKTKLLLISRGRETPPGDHSYGEGAPSFTSTRLGRDRRGHVQ